MQETYFKVYSKLINGKILKKIGQALGLLLYLYDKSTYQQEGICVVLGGTRITNEEIANDLNVDSRSITRRVKLLTELGFIHTITVQGNLRIWFVIGYQKWKKDSPSKKKLDSLVRRARADILKDVNNGAIKPINPFFSEADNSVTMPDVQETKTSTINDKSVKEQDKSVMGQDKNGMSNKDSTVDNTIDTTEITLNKDILPNNQSSTAAAIEPTANADVLEVFRFYMSMMGSKRRTPSHEVYKLIESILAEEGVSTLKDCIDNYKKMVDETDNWRFYSPLKFFAGDFYMSFLDANRGSQYEARRPVKDFTKSNSDSK